MPRLPENVLKERQRNLTDVAEKLFIKKGYENTSVDAIVNELHLAKGTFYYHFKSKADILVAVCENILSSLQVQVQRICSADSLDATEKMTAAFKTLYDTFHNNKDIWFLIHRNDNIAMHNRLIAISTQTLSPLLAEILQEGIEKQQFNPLPPLEAAEAIIALFDHFIKQNLKADSAAQIDRILVTLETMLSRILGVAPYSFRSL